MVEQLPVSSNLPIARLLAEFGSNLSFSVEMAAYTSYQTGGKAKYLVTCLSGDEVAKAARAAKRLGIQCFFLGGGTNVLVSDEGFDGVVIKVDVEGLAISEPNVIKCGAGEQLQSLVDFATNNGLAGLEFAAGIYGTVGGAIYGNAGAYGGEIGSIVRTVDLVSPAGEVRTVTPDYCSFGYRDSHLKRTGEAIISAEFNLKPGDEAEIRGKVEEILAIRLEKHPVESNTAGCFFKNIPDKSAPHGKLAAGKLLEEAGAKSLSVGNAAVSDQHANIIVNKGKATSKEISQLADMMKRQVCDKFGITLEEEVVRIGNF